MSITDELKPCPFCGGTPRVKHLFSGGEPTHSRVECTRCHIKTDYCWNYDGADCGLVARARDLGVEVD